jgi:hypothetical protein
LGIGWWNIQHLQVKRKLWSVVTDEHVRERQRQGNTISKRPGRRRAASIALGRLVAAKTIIPCNRKPDNILMNREVDAQ